MKRERLLFIGAYQSMVFPIILFSIVIKAVSIEIEFFLLLANPDSIESRKICLLDRIILFVQTD